MKTPKLLLYCICLSSFFFLTTRIYAATIDEEMSGNSMATEFENYFHVKFVNQEQMIAFLREKEMLYEKNLSTCNPGTYYYGYMGMMPIFAKATIFGLKNGKCIESTVAFPGVKFYGKSLTSTTRNCQYNPSDLPTLFAAPYQIKKSIRNRDCQVK